jgi:hypothetical protein
MSSKTDKTEDKKESKKKKPGRKSNYSKKYHTKWAESLAKRGVIDKEMAKDFGISEQTLNTWKKKHPEFFESLKKGKKIPDDEVERSLFERATGYSCPDTKVFYDSKRGEVITQPITKHYAPDPTSMIFWLKNRRPDKWRDKQEVDHNMSNEVLEVINSIFSKKDKKLK